MFTSSWVSRQAEDPLLLTAVFCFVTASAILLLNLLIAQLNCSYVYIYQNMLGYAARFCVWMFVKTFPVSSINGGRHLNICVISHVRVVP